MHEGNKEKLTKSVDKTNKTVEGDLLGADLNSDNSFSDNGLENAVLLSETMKKN